MAGDVFCQVIFYYVSDFIWKNNDLRNKYKYNRQESLLKAVFEIEDTEDWRERYTREESTVPVINWKGDTMIHANRTAINKIVYETCLLGPLAAMYGREFQQLLIENEDKTKIRVTAMQKSVDSGRAALNDHRIEKLSLHTEKVRKNTKYYLADSNSHTHTIA